MKKVISVMLCCVMLFACAYVHVSATEGKTVLYLNYGDIRFDQYGVSGYDENGEFITEDNPLGYVVTQKNPNTVIDKGVTVSSTTCSIEILNLNVRRLKDFNSPFLVKGTSEVTVTLSGENHLTPGMNRAALEIEPKAKATINGDGMLYANSSLQAGIGGGNGKSNGTLVIDSGTIYAIGGVDGYSAGIGGATTYGHGGNITINGGYVFAQGGLYGTGIGGGYMGGGGNITINGGVVTAIGGDGGAGIGSGYMCEGATDITINGGSVKAVAGTSGEAVGNGYKATTTCSGVHNSDGNAVSLVNLSVSDFKQIYINGTDTYPVTMLHPDDDKLYVYTDSTDKIITEYMNDGSVSFFKLNSTKTQQVYPYLNGCERCEDKLITSSLDSISIADGFTVNENNELVFNSVPVDTFTFALRGDVNLDGNLDGMDAVIVNCAVNNMLNDNLTVKLSDADGNGTVNNDDKDLLIQYGVEVK